MNVNELLSPSLLVYPKLIEQNLDAMIRVAGSAQRLRPHCKTHKMREVVAMQLARGITKHKCATLMEAEMLADCGVKDILLAYNVVGPNIARVVRLLERWPASCIVLFPARRASSPVGCTPTTATTTSMSWPTAAPRPAKFGGSRRA